MRLSKYLIGAAFSTVFLVSAANAGPQEDVLIDKIVKAYGGETFTGLRALKIDNTNSVISIGQSHDPSVVDIGLNKSSQIIDYANGRSSLENWNVNRGGSFLNQAFFDGEKGYALDHLAKTRSENPNLTFGAVGGGSIRTLDTTIVKVLLENRESAKYGGEVDYQGRKHETITFPMEGSPDLTIFVDKNTGFVSKMTRENPQFGTLTYIYHDHKRSGGVTYSSASSFMIAGQPNSLISNRKLTVNPDLSGVFEVPADYREQGSTIDTSEMIVRKLADGIYYAGQNGGMSIFVDAGDHYVAAGGYAGLTARFDAVKEAAGVDKPLRYQVVTHQHSDHIGGLGEAAALGANLVTVESHIPPIQGSLQETLPDNRFILVNEKTSLAGGKMEVYDITTAHAAHYLLVYIPSIKLVFSADHFSTNLIEGLPIANNNMATFRTAVEALDLDIDGFLGAHGTRQLTMADLRAATDGYRVASCPANRSICQD